MSRPKKDSRSLAVRLWVFQKERAPVASMLLSASLTVGVFAHFAQFSLRHYLVAVFIVALYLVQTRTSDEKKDFEHDNKYHKDRPVQRGVVSLGELLVVNRLSIVTQLVLYASFFNTKILLFGLASQGYAFLTRKEFFVREWIRQHFFTYYFFHYIQLVILNLAMLQIIQPISVARWQLVTFVMLNIIIVEVGRKMFGVEDDTTDDTFSAQLGHKGSALTFTFTGLAITYLVYYFIQHNAQNYLLIILPVMAMGAIANSAYHYAVEPNRANATNVKNAGLLMVLASMLGVIFGA